MKHLDCKRALKITKILFYGGFALAVVSLAVCATLNAFPPVWTALSVVGVVGCVAGIVFCCLTVRCPFCGASLMLGGRIPSELPRHCPSCGSKL